MSGSAHVVFDGGHGLLGRIFRREGTGQGETTCALGSTASVVASGNLYRTISALWRGSIVLRIRGDVTRPT